MSNGIRSLAKDTVIYGATNILSKFLNWLLAPFYIRILTDSAEYGIVTNLYAWVSVILVVLTLGLETGLFRFINTSKRPRMVYATCLKLLGAVVALFLTVTICTSGKIATALHYSDHPEYIAIFAVITGIDAMMSLPFAYLRYQRRPLKFAFYKILFIGLNIGFNLFFLLLLPYLSRQGCNLPLWLYRPNYEVGYIFISNLLATGIEALLMAPILRHGIKGFDRDLIRPLANYCWPLVLLGLAGNFNKMAGQILIPYLYPSHDEGMSALGIFGGNLKIAVIMVMFMQAFRFAYDPFVFAKMKAKDSGLAYREAMNYFVLFSMLIFLFVMYGIDIFKVIVRPDYYSGLTIVPYMMASEIAFGIYYNLSVWYKVSDRTYYGAIFSIIGLIVTLCIIILGVPAHGFVACAWAALACNMVMLLLSFSFGQKLHPIDYDLTKLLGTIGIGIAFYYGGMMIDVEPMWLRLTLRMLCFTAYLTAEIKLFFPEVGSFITSKTTKH